MGKENQDSKALQRDTGIQRPIAPRLLPIREAAKALGLTLWSMRERCWNGDIPFVRFPGGRKVFIDTRDIEKFINQNKITMV